MLKQRSGWLGWWPQDGIKAVLDPENSRIKEFLTESEITLSADAKVLDASAGSKPYQDIFSKCNYESCDVPDAFYNNQHDFECYLDNIPRDDASYDAVLLTQVLEHVPDPAEVMIEIHRILKEDGQLFLSVPLNAPLHGEPWHFFHFTHYGIIELSKKAHFKVEEIEKIGGSFWILGKRLPDAFRKLFKQYDPFRAKKRKMNTYFCLFMNILLLPVYFFIYLPLAYIFRPVCYWLDYIDKEKSFTLGYTAILRKSNN